VQVLDTVSQFFIVEDGVRTPVFVVDTTSVTRNIERSYSRLRTNQQLSISFESGYYWEFRTFLLGASLGVVSSWVIDQSEFETLSGQVDNAPFTQGNPLLGLLIQVPVHFKSENKAVTSYFSPFVSWMVDPSSNDTSGTVSKNSFGIRFGWVF
ncbi:MAG: hypothetical protein AAGA66_17545, partial [Bacteroidota bacterium]